ncbi:cupin domain-containing protein [Halobacteroides halobius DSM 5150]|uniref:Cupin domain-containing protein n=1 Tax=Halobacteroides halobius (strain ATCC 35273 / DSM 5150 / MD-1) TaxID=748449 RepID=L0K6D1_HALHC|nr:cupin domain-containing protein [Halobacteroides halobius]AGB40797.1 cupin domain-containing protein [Halobacteroides halobius DSM 5150]
MDLEAIKEKVDTNIYHIPADKEVPLHKHTKEDEIFYCIKGAGVGILEEEEIELEVGDTFVVPAGKMHSVKTNNEIYLTSFLVPVIEQ